MLGMNKWMDKWMREQKSPQFPVFQYRVAAQKVHMLACAYFRPGNIGNTASHNNVCVLVDILMNLNMAK